MVRQASPGVPLALAEVPPVAAQALVQPWMPLRVFALLRFH
jgi:hypothetical protein